MTMFSSFRCAFLPGANSTSVLAGVSCLFDASCIIFLGFQLLEMHTSITMRQLFLGYGVLAAVLCGSLSMLWGRYEPWLPTSDQVEPVSGSYDVGPLDTLPLFEQLKTPEFFCILIYATINLTRANMYIGTQDILLLHLSDTGTYSKMFSIILPCGPIFVPVIERCDHCFGTITSLQITVLLGALYNGICLVDSLPAQIGAFFFYTAFRAFLYSVMAAFVAEKFGLATLGRIQGIVFTVAGAFNMVQYVLVGLIHGPLKGNPFWVNTGQLAILLPIFMMVEYLRSSTVVPIVEAVAGTSDPQPQPKITPQIPNEERMFLARAASSGGSPSLVSRAHWSRVRKKLVNPGLSASAQPPGSFSP